MTGRLLLLGMGQMGRPYLKAARALDRDVTLVELPRRLAMAERAGIIVPGEGWPADGETEEAWYAAALRAIRSTERPAGIVAFTEPHVIPAAMIADELGLPGPGLRAALLSRNKAMQRARFADAGLPQPAFCVCHGEDDARAWAKSRYPVIAKPLDKAGSEGVALTLDKPELDNWMAQVPERPFLLERYTEGDEVSLEAAFSHGEMVFSNVTWKDTSGPPEFVELEHVVPAPVSARQLEWIEEVGSGVAQALDMRSGIIHLELRFGDSGVSIMEVAVRTPGDHIMELIELAVGVDLFAVLVRLACGEDFPIHTTHRSHAGAWFPSVGPGTVISVDGIADIERLDGFSANHLKLSEGLAVNRLTSSRDRVGALLFAAPTHDRLIKCIADAKSKLIVRMT